MEFGSGQMVVTAGVNDEIADNTAFAKFVIKCLARHAVCDWGDLCAEDKKQNDWSLKNGERLLSAYEEAPMRKIWIITERDRSATTVLFPDEY